MPNHSTKQVAELLGITARAVRFWAERHEIGQKVGRDWVFTDEDIDRLKQRKTAPGPETGSKRKPHALSEKPTNAAT